MRTRRDSNEFCAFGNGKHELLCQIERNVGHFFGEKIQIQIEDERLVQDRAVEFADMVFAFDADEFPDESFADNWLYVIPDTRLLVHESRERWQVGQVAILQIVWIIPQIGMLIDMDNRYPTVKYASGMRLVPEEQRMVVIVEQYRRHAGYVALQKRREPARSEDISGFVGLGKSRHAGRID